MTVLTANNTTILIDGKKVPGLRSISYKTIRNRQDVPEIGINERINVVFGRWKITGTIIVNSVSEMLNKHMEDDSPFQIVVSMLVPPVTPDGQEATKKLTFDTVHLDDREFSLDAHGYALTTYTFTATRIREE
jgi:hypothetical protein